VNEFITVYRRWNDFGGRSRRREYWMFYLFNLLISCAFYVILKLDVQPIVLLLAPLAILYALVTLVPGIAVAIRRLHDTGRSGWWMLIALFPILGGLTLLLFMVMEGEPGENRWGASPKAPV